MSFGAIERTRAKGRPVNLFYVKYGSAPNSFYAYTDAEKAITNNGVTYQPLAISRGKIVVSGTLDKAAMEVRMTLNVPLAEHFRVYPPTQTVNLTIFQGHLSDTATQFLVAWTGRVISSKRTDNELIAALDNALRSAGFDGWGIKVYHPKAKGDERSIYAPDSNPPKKHIGHGTGLSTVVRVDVA